MNSFTLAQKQALAVLEKAGTHVYFLSYNPLTVVGNPESIAIGLGYTQYYKETTTKLVEVIYTK